MGKPTQTLGLEWGNESPLRAPLGHKACEELSVKMGYSSANFALRGWNITVRGNHVYGWAAGPKHRLDVSFSASKLAAARDLPHGIIGQSFASEEPRHGKVDLYPEVGGSWDLADVGGAAADCSALSPP